MNAGNKVAAVAKVPTPTGTNPLTASKSGLDKPEAATDNFQISSASTEADNLVSKSTSA